MTRRQAELVGWGRGWHVEQLALLCNALGAKTVTLVAVVGGGLEKEAAGQVDEG